LRPGRSNLRKNFFSFPGHPPAESFNAEREKTPRRLLAATSRQPGRIGESAETSSVRRPLRAEIGVPARKSSRTSSLNRTGPPEIGAAWNSTPVLNRTEGPTCILRLYFYRRDRAERSRIAPRSAVGRRVESTADTSNLALPRPILPSGVPRRTAGIAGHDSTTTTLARRGGGGTYIDSERQSRLLQR